MLSVVPTEVIIVEGIRYFLYGIQFPCKYSKVLGQIIKSFIYSCYTI